MHALTSSPRTSLLPSLSVERMNDILSVALERVRFRKQTFTADVYPKIQPVSVTITSELHRVAATETEEKKSKLVNISDKVYVK